MKIKIVSTVVLLLIIHLSPLVTSCGPGRCGDQDDIFVSVEDANVDVYAWGQQTYTSNSEAPLDRRNLWIEIELTYPDLEDYYTNFSFNSGLISGAFATSCPPPSIFPIEYITDIEILLVDELDESTQDITSDFLAGWNWGGLYQEVSEFLVEEDRYHIQLVYREIPTADSQTWIVNTTLSDNRVMRDTLSFSLQ